MRNALTPGQASRPIRHQASHRLRDRHRRLRQHGPRPPQDHDQRKAPSHARHQLGLLCLVFVLVNHTAVEHGLQISHGFERVGWDRSLRHGRERGDCCRHRHSHSRLRQHGPRPRHLVRVGVGVKVRARVSVSVRFRARVKTAAWAPRSGMSSQAADRVAPAPA